GNAARGIGRVTLHGEPLYRVFDCGVLEQHAASLEEHRSWRSGGLPEEGIVLRGDASVDTNNLSLTLKLAIPRGEDLLIGDGQGVDFDIEPQRVRGADGRVRWKLPGSSFRGVLRGWFTRLAARAGEPVADSIHRRMERQKRGEVLSGDDLAWGFDAENERERKRERLAREPDALAEEVPCPVMRLFGSSYARGRIHISDALSDLPVADGQEQERAHVAIDRITGGANEGFFFRNSVLTGDPTFTLTLCIDSPSDKDVRWLIGSLRALHLGILRVGSSKAGGRLELAQAPEASGPYQQRFIELDLSKD
ncbi:MAG: RAMP superfamily CRISPR-associated protein, partial [Verrucomicrobiota bacterium]